jgi:hypothetical protein
MDERRVMFKGVGPLTRSTVGDEVPDPNEEALSDVLHWIWSWRVQVRRLVESTKEEGLGADALEQRKSLSKVSYDEHLLAVVGWNLARSIDRASERFPQMLLAERIKEAMELLRHLYEHWDEQRGFFQDATALKERSGKRFVEMFPEGKPWSMVYTTDDWLLGGVVSIAALTRELEPIEAVAIRLERERKAKQKS